MRTLSILLCSLLVLAPAQGQQAVRRTAPNFYVSYGVRDVPVAPLDGYSSSDAQDGQIYERALAAQNAPMPQRYPMRGQRCRPCCTPYGMYQPPRPAFTGVLVTLGIIAVILGAAGIAGMQ